jgi:hypothetical protein
MSGLHIAHTLAAAIYGQAIWMRDAMNHSIQCRDPYRMTRIASYFCIPLFIHSHLKHYLLVAFAMGMQPLVITCITIPAKEWNVFIALNRDIA